MDQAYKHASISQILLLSNRSVLYLCLVFLTSPFTYIYIYTVCIYKDWNGVFPLLPWFPSCLTVPNQSMASSDVTSPWLPLVMGVRHDMYSCCQQLL